MNDLISVILPVYQIPKEILFRCLESLQAQSYECFEALVVDDGNEEPLTEYTSMFSNDDRLIFLQQKHEGVSSARNFGLEKARGTYVCFVDPDDYIEKDYLKLLYDAIISSEADIAITDCLVDTIKGTKKNRFLSLSDKTVLSGENKKLLSDQLLSKKLVTYYPPLIASGVPWCKMFRRAFLDDDNLRFPVGMPRMQDNIFCLYAFNAARTIVYTKSFQYHYDARDGSASRRYDPMILSKFEDYFQKTEEFLELYGSPEEKEAFGMKKLTSFHSIFGRWLFHKENTDSWKEQKEKAKALLKEEPYQSLIKRPLVRWLTCEERLYVFAMKYGMFMILKIYALIFG